MTKVDQFKLSNGLPVILVEMPEVPSVAIGFMTKVGQRDGGMEKKEISHVLEHLVFDGTDKLPDRTEIAVAIDEIGGEFGGETYEEYSYYFIKCEPKAFSRAAFILGEIIVHPLLSAKELEKEKIIIAQELNLREDDPLIKIIDELQETVFPNHPLGCSRAEAVKSLPKMSREDLLAHWQKNYRTGSSVLVVCGDLPKIGKVKDLAEEYFAELGKGERELLEKVGPETKGMTKVIDKKTSQIHFALGGRAYPLSDPKVYAARLMDIIFGHIASSRLFLEIREERKLAYAVFSNIDFYQDTGVFSVYAGVDKNRLEEAIQAVMAEMTKIVADKEKGITDRELKKAKNFLSGRLAVQMDDPANQVAFYAKRFLFEKEVITPEELVARYQKVGREELVAIAKDLFKPEKINLVVMGEGIEKEKVEKIFGY